VSNNRITNIEGSPALLLPEDVLDELGVAIGDEVDLSIVMALLSFAL
jgi:antitoxin component of MazEF toxin-antitoxin module